MKIKISYFHVCAVAILTLVAGAATPSVPAHELSPAPSPVCEVEILVGGQPVQEYLARGTAYIEAHKGREYDVRLTNRTDRRIAVALAIDGLNSIDAKHADPRRASKWVLGPFESTTISGWQTSAGTARRFFFTSEENSYGEWLGQTANLGVIEAVVFRERLPELILELGAGKAPAPSGRADRRARPSAEAAPQSADQSDADDLAATGIGREIDHRVRRVQLDLEDSPAAHIRLRYEYRQQLVHLGVLPTIDENEALARRERASGFTDFTFAPDPFNR